ncbi:MAG: chain length determinant protein EpsF [Pseudomonadota bacterium]|nr:chain length determinant protein EpsF [Pseudomonadota bacterium]
MNFHQVVLALKARWREALIVFLLVATVTLAVDFLLPVQYTATSSVVIDAKTDPVVGGPGMAYSADLLASYITTQVDVIASERVAQRVVKTLNLDQIPDLRAQWVSATQGRGDITVWLADYLIEKKLVVTPAHESDVIEISVKWGDAAMAAALANAFAQAAIDTNIDLKVEPAKQYAGWFERRSRELRTDLEIKRRRLSDFQNATGIVATDEKLDVENARLAELSTELVAIQAQRQDSESRQKQLGGDNQSLPEVLQSPVIASLKDDLSQAEAKRQDVAARLGRNHPDYQAVEAEVVNLRDRIAQETVKIAASLGSTTQVNVRRESDIRAALEAQKRRVLELRHAHDEAAVLDSEIASAQRNLDAVSQRLAQSSLESQNQQTNMVQLTYAVPPFKHSSPKLLFNGVMGIFLAAALAFAWALLREVRDRRVRDDGDLQELVDLPLLGKIGKVARAPNMTPSTQEPPASLSGSPILSIR